MLRIKLGWLRPPLLLMLCLSGLCSLCCSLSLHFGFPLCVLIYFNSLFLFSAVPTAFVPKWVDNSSHRNAVWYLPKPKPLLPEPFDFDKALEEIVANKHICQNYLGDIDWLADPPKFDNRVVSSPFHRRHGECSSPEHVHHRDIPLEIKPDHSDLPSAPLSIWSLSFGGVDYELVGNPEVTLATVVSDISLYCDILHLSKVVRDINVQSLISHFRGLSDRFSKAEKVALAELSASEEEDITIAPHFLSSEGDAFDRDIIELRRLGNLGAVVLQHQARHQPDRFNCFRVRSMFKDDPDFEILLDLATHGARVETDPTFEPVWEPFPLRKLHLRLKDCMMRHAMKLFFAGKGLVFDSKNLLPEHLHRLHISSPHWTPKQDSPAGRFLIDCSNHPSGCAVNSEYSKQAAITRYGRVDNPLDVDIFSDWLEFVEDKGVRLRDCRLSKCDIKGAFNQFNFSKDSALLMAVWIAIGLIFIFTNGNFGWTGSPMVFGCIGRALLRYIRKSLKGVSSLYCDDFATLSLEADAHEDLRIIIRACTDCFGPGCIEESKTLLPSLRGEILGWQVDLVEETIHPNTKGCDKLLFSFFSVNLTISQPVKTWQLLASLAERYSRGIVGMRSFVRPLHYMIHLCGPHPNAKRRPNSEAKLCIEMWRAVSILLWHSPQQLAVPIFYLARGRFFPTPKWFLITDASPWKVCIAIYDSSHRLQCWYSLRFPFRKDDHSESQNSREYLGLLVGLLILGLHTGSSQEQQYVHWTTDNTSAQSWALCGKAGSLSSQLTNISITLVQLRFNLLVTRVTHLAGIKMKDIDNESRDNPAPSLLPRLRFSLTPTQLSQLNRLLQQCDPSSELSSLRTLDALTRISELLESFL